MNHYIITFPPYKDSIDRDMVLSNILRLGQGNFVNNELHIKTSLKDKDFREYVARFNSKGNPELGETTLWLALNIYSQGVPDVSDEEEALEFLRNVFAR